MRGEVKRVRSVPTAWTPSANPAREVVGQVEALRIGHVALLVGELGVTLRVDALGRAIVHDAVGLQDAVLVIELDPADGGDDVVIPVVDQLIGFEDQLVGIARRRPLGRGRLGESGPCEEQHSEPQRQARQHAAAAASASGGRADGAAHQPSSWCRST